MTNQQSLLDKVRVSNLPNGWKIKTIGEACLIRNDLRKPISVEERDKMQGRYPYYGPTGILSYINNYLADGCYALIGEDGDHFLKYESKDQTLLVKGKFNVNNHAHIIEATKECSVEWFYHFFKHRNITSFLSRQGAGRYKLNKDTLRRLPIIIPPSSEQIAVADMLSTWDHAIEKAELLIAAKEKRKKSIMQLLLTGKRRLRNCRKPWSEYCLGELFKERIERACDHLPLLSVTREEGIVRRNEDRKDTSSDDKSNYLKIYPGDIGYNTMRMWQGVSAISALEGIISPAYTVCIPQKTVDGEFMSYLFKLPRIINLFYRYSQGLTSDTWNLKFHHFREIKVTIPEIEEQKAIARILNTCDEEVKCQKNILSTYKKQKRGLMQKLLTGQWRVKIAKGA